MEKQKCKKTHLYAASSCLGSFISHKYKWETIKCWEQEGTHKSQSINKIGLNMKKRRKKQQTI